MLLNNINLTHDHVPALMNALHYYPFLHHLSLPSNPLLDRGLSLLAQYLPSSLHTLHLCAVEMSHTVLKTLLTALPREFHGLTQLNCSRNCFSIAKEWNKWIHSVPPCTALRTLDMLHCYIDSWIVEQIRAILSPRQRGRISGS